MTRSTSEYAVDMFKDEETEQFFQLVHMFQRSALLHMGMIPDQEGNMMFNLGEGKSRNRPLTNAPIQNLR